MARLLTNNTAREFIRRTCFSCQTQSAYIYMATVAVTEDYVTTWDTVGEFATAALVHDFDPVLFEFYGLKSS